MADIRGIKTFPYRPEEGRRVLSVNLALADLTEITEIAKELGFKPELIQIQSRSGIQAHALLWEGAIADTPADMDDKVDYLANRINAAAIRHVAGAWTQRSLCGESNENDA